MPRSSTHVIKHYRSLWGEPTRRAEFHVAERSVQVFKWNPGQTGEGVTIYATAGVSDYVLGPESESHRTEIVVGLQPEEDRIAHPLGTLALGSRSEEPYLLHGHTVRYDEPLWDGTEMCGFLITNPREPVVPAITIDALHIQFVHAITLFASELEFKKTVTTDVFLSVWQKCGCPFWDPGRSPCVPSGEE